MAVLGVYAFQQGGPGWDVGRQPAGADLRSPEWELIVGRILG